MSPSDRAPAWFGLVSTLALAVFRFLRDMEKTLPIMIFNCLRYGYTPATSVVFVVGAVAVFGLVGRFANLRRLPGARREQERL